METKKTDGLKKRTRKAFGIRKKEKDNDSTGSPDREGSQKRTNGAPNGFYGDIDWERYKTHFFSSDESEEEEEQRRKFKIKIKPLPPDCVIAAPTVDELKASIGNIALSPSLVKESETQPVSPPLLSLTFVFLLPSNVFSWTKTAEAMGSKSDCFLTCVDVLVENTGFGLRLSFCSGVSSACPVQSPYVVVFLCHVFTASFGRISFFPFLSIYICNLWSPTPFKGLNRNPSNEEFVRPRRVVPAAVAPVVAPAPAPQPPSTLSPVSEDTQALFGPPLETAFGEQKSEVVLSDAWGVPLSESNSSLSRSFPTGTPPPLPPKNVPTTPPTAGSVDNPDSSTEAENAHRKPSIADLDNLFGPEAAPPAAEETSDSWVCFSEDSPPKDLPCSPPAPEEPAPPPPSSPPPPLPTSPPPLQAPSPPPALLHAQKKTLLHPHPPPQQKNLEFHLNRLRLTSTAVAPSSHVPEEKARESPPATLSKENSVEATVNSPKDVNQESRSTPPPPPPPSYRTMVSSPGPTSGTNSGSSSPVRPSTPSSVNPTPPPPPPRPPSRPKLPPGKPTAADGSRPFSPPVHSASPPPVAPLARAESTSSISSTNSAATTPTVNKELCVSVSEDDAFVDKLPSFERHFDAVAENDQPSLVWFDRGKFYLTFEGCSRGPSPLTMGAQDTLPVAAAFTETVNAFFKGADTSKCVVKVIGEMVVSFPAGITRHFANNPSPAVLTFSITNYSRLEQVLPNPQLLCCVVLFCLITHLLKYSKHQCTNEILLFKHHSMNKRRRSWLNFVVSASMSECENKKQVLWVSVQFFSLLSAPRSMSHKRTSGCDILASLLKRKDGRRMEEKKLGSWQVEGETSRVIIMGKPQQLVCGAHIEHLQSTWTSIKTL
ncbi:hypothetical protein WMY93_024841 [Mugilogobius chulae]|uniref:Muniscin C-terminal domain-containing protein n=1 Tax=Mugilogobius chulae TaxID=88201 RepID=A0AAW0ND94_9GOBI